MRFIVRFKYGILQTKTERIDVNFCENTTQIIEYLEKKVHQKNENFIARFKRGKNYLRILPGWKLDDYGLKEGSEIHIEMIESQEVENKKIAHIGNRYISNVLGVTRELPKSMDPVIETVEEEEKDAAFSVRRYLDTECERMLKEIQRKNMEGFRSIFEEIPDDVPEEFLMEIKQKKMDLIDELGEKGWGALHYAIFCEADEILDELLALDADVNKCTSDGWLPIQLAINIKSREIIEKLLEDPNLNLNLSTSRGAPIHTAARLGQKDILMIILEKEIDVHIKDGNGKTAYDLCLDEECRNLLKKYEEKRESYNEYVRGNLPLSLTTIFRGSIMKAKRPFMNLKDRYLLVDPFQGSMIRYENQEDYPKRAKEITPLSTVKGVRIVPEE